MNEDDLVSLSNGQESGWLDMTVEDTLAYILPVKLMKVGRRLPDQTEKYAFMSRLTRGRKSSPENNKP